MKKSMFAMFLVAAVSAAAQWDAGAPRINGPKVYGATPGRAFLYAFPTCGSREGLKFAVSDGTLPAGVVLDEKTGVLSGKVAEAGEYPFEVSAARQSGASKQLEQLKKQYETNPSPALRKQIFELSGRE